MQIHGHDLNQEQIKFLKGCKYLFWWQSLEDMLKYPEKILTKAMNEAVWEDWQRIELLFSPTILQAIVDKATFGEFHGGMWNFWHKRLNPDLQFADIPPLPKRYADSPIEDGQAFWLNSRQSILSYCRSFCCKTVKNWSYPMLSNFFSPLQGCEFSLPIGGWEKAAAFMKKNLAYCVFNTLRLMEKNPTNLPDTKLILNGRTVAGLSVEDLIQVKHFGDATKKLVRMIEDRSFVLNIETMKDLHFFVAMEDALEWGVLRTSQVFVGDCQYVPSDAKDLPMILESGITEIKKMDNPLDQALNAFAFFSKVQPFFDGNKRTAMLMANGILMDAGIYPLFIPASMEAETAKAIDELYEKGETSCLQDVFTAACAKMYPPSIDYGPRWEKDDDHAPK